MAPAPREVDVEHAAPVRLVDLRNPLGRDDRGAGDQRVEPGQGAVGNGERVRDARRVGDVERDRGGPQPGLGQRGGAGEHRVVDVGEQHVGAQTGEASRGLEPHAAGRTGDQHAVAGERILGPAHGASSPSGSISHSSLTARLTRRITSAPAAPLRSATAVASTSTTARCASRVTIGA